MSKTLHFTSHNVPFVANILEQGDNLGLKNNLIHEHIEPVVQFFDTRYPHNPLGQFVSSYFLSTLLNGSSREKGLNLYGGEPEWSVDQKDMEKVCEWLDQHPITKKYYDNNSTDMHTKTTSKITFK